MTSLLAERFRPFGTTIFTEMTLLAQKHQAVNLAQGFPDFDGPAFVKAAAAEAMSAGHNQYARMFGAPPLNQAIAAWWRECTGAEVQPDSQITVTSGCTEAIAAAMLGLVNPGDEVILFEPYYDSYRASVAMAGGVARFVPLRAVTVTEGGRVMRRFAFDAAELAAAFSGRTRLILVNTPHNPTGKVFTREELAQIASLCQKHDVIAMTDEVYERLTFDVARPHVRLATLPGMAERTLTLSSLGKTFSLTGWKIGWAIGPAELTRAVRAAHQFLTFATATPFQHGAAAALGQVGPREAYIDELMSLYRWGRGYLSASLAELGFDVFEPEGTYFLMVDWTRVPAARRAGWADDVAFCRGLTEQAGVAAIPPSAFYDSQGLGRPLARFAFCKRRETLEEGVRRLRAWAARV